MGLDAWLMAKTKTEEITDSNSATGACSGLFGIIPTAVADAVELCYLRKGYDQRQLLWEYGTPGDDDVDDFTWHYDKSDLEMMLEEATRILTTHKFDEEDGYDLTDDDPKFTSESGTFISKTKWENLIAGLKKALEIINKDPDADIYYHEWF